MRAKNATLVKERWTDGPNPSFHEVLHILSTTNPNRPESMTETSAIELRVRLPRPLAEEVERVKESDPDALSRIVAYGVTRRMIFDHLVAREGRVAASEDRRY